MPAGLSKGKRNAEQMQAQKLWKEIQDLKASGAKASAIAPKQAALDAYKNVNAGKIAEPAI